jgi:hypothetical protein
MSPGDKSTYTEKKEERGLNNIAESYEARGVQVKETGGALG